MTGGVRPLKVSVTVTAGFTEVVGVPKAYDFVPVAEPSAVKAAVLSHVAVAVFVPEDDGLGAEA